MPVERRRPLIDGEHAPEAFPSVRRAQRREAYERRRRREQRERRRGKGRYRDIKEEERAAGGQIVTLAGPGRVGLKRIETRAEEQPIYDRRLDEEPYPGEPTYAERLHGVTRPYTPPPPAIQALSGAWMRYEKWMEGPERFFREKAASTLERAREAKLKGKDVEAGLTFSAYMGLHAVGSIYTGATIHFRPLAALEGVKTGVGLLLSGRRRAEMARAISQDPGLLVGLPAAALGARLTGLGITKVKGAYQEWKTRRFLKRYPVEDFLPYEETIKFPETVMEEQTTFRGFEKKYVKIYDDTVSAKFPYVRQLEPGAVVDIGKGIIDEMGKPEGPPVTEILKSKKGLLYKYRGEYGLVKTGEGLVPTLLPEGVGRVEPVFVPLSDIRAFETHLPGLPLDVPVYTPPIPSPGLSPWILGGLATLRGPTGVERLDLDTKGRLKTIDDTVERLRERKGSRLIFKHRFKTIPEEMVEQWIYTPPTTIPDVTTTLIPPGLIPILDQPTITIPQLDQPTRLVPRLESPQETTPKRPPPFWPPPSIPRFAPPPVKPPRLPRRFLRRGKKRGKGVGFSIFGEMRGYPVKMPKDILKELLGSDKKMKKLIRL